MIGINARISTALCHFSSVAVGLPSPSLSLPGNAHENPHVTNTDQHI
ncbi:MAG: hypothetical protein IJW40_03995 [Clostridia bacterium]|nr:hypothetical protein [Clostridia bacterium]